jgi:hypothetical protein
VTPARALVDSSSVLPLDVLRRAVREALALKRVTIKELIATPGQRHRHLNDIIAEGYEPATSSRTRSSTSSTPAASHGPTSTSP